MEMSEYLDQVEIAVESSSAGAEQTVVLFRAIEEAELQRDVAGLERALELARRIALQSDGTLHEEAGRLVRLCEERLEVVRAMATTATPAVAASEEPCPGCGRPLLGSPVRCRYCGQVFV
jgi:ABC-type branched-subunit amino acid transport system ATPase component